MLKKVCYCSYIHRDRHWWWRMMLPKTHEQGQIVQAQPEKKPTNPVQQIDSSVNHQVPDNNNAQQSTIALTGEKENKKYRI